MTPEDQRGRRRSGDLLHRRLFNQNTRKRGTGEFRLNADIAGNRDFLTYLRNQGNSRGGESIGFGADYAHPDRNVYDDGGFYVHNGRHGIGGCVFINGIGLVNESRASKDEAIASRWINRRYHAETPR